MNNSEETSRETEERWRKDPNNWIWGIFYYNKEDKRLFVSKKLEWMGTTLNFANPKSVLFTIGFLLFFAFILTMIIIKN
jgi:uncharacterized membrane protein